MNFKYLFVHVFVSNISMNFMFVSPHVCLF